MRVGFRAKVLIPVVALFVLVPVTTLWIIQERGLEQFERGTRQRLRTADAVLTKTLEIRAAHLLAQYRNVVNDPGFKAASKLQDAKTMQAKLVELRDELAGDEVILFSPPAETGVASPPGVSRDPALRQDVRVASTDSIRAALAGEPPLVRTIFAGGRLFHALSVPARVGQELTGVLTVAVPIGKEVIEDLKSVTRGEIVLIANGQTVDSTLRDRDAAASLPAWLNQTRDQNARQLLIERDHYLGLAGVFANVPAEQNLGYVLLFSYEDSWQLLRDTQRMLWLVSLAGVVFSLAAGWMLVGRATAPLLQLRDNAEAVGRGDFSRRIELNTGDEIGELARAFNQMTANLQSSRTELEKALETVKSTQAQLVQREKLSAVGEFVAGVAHELNNPLTTVLGFAELLQTDALDAKQKQALGYITQSAERCRRIVQSLLSFARQHQPERTWSDLNELIDGIIDLIGFDFKRNGVEIQREYAKDLGKVLVDPHQLQQVFVNIMTNARHAIEDTGATGCLRVITERGRDMVRIIFEDDGPGIRAEALPRIFDPFFTTKGDGRGTGLGLSLSYGIIKEHGGAITVDSRLGQGTRFTIELPAVGAEAPVPATMTSAVPAARPLRRGKRALVIDDEDWILRLIESVLRAEGFEIDAAAGGEAGRACLARQSYDVILCDLRMPGVSGLQLYEEVKRGNAETAGRFIFMTGDVVSETSREFLKDQKRFLTKPFSPRDLQAIVGRFFGVAS